MSKRKTNKSNRRKSSFFADLQELRNKYPQVYLEAWTPDDYEFIRENKNDSESAWDSEALLADWSEPQWIAVADQLYHQFDANNGTSWLTLEHAIESSVEQ